MTREAMGAGGFWSLKVIRETGDAFGSGVGGFTENGVR
jgi:hypothetical protein